MADPNSENAPTARNSTPNHGADGSLKLLRLQSAGTTRRSEDSAGRRGSSSARSDVRVIVRTVTSTKLNTCSMLANRHQLLHRVHVGGCRFEDVAGRRRVFGLGRAGHRAHQSRHVLPHAESLVANPVALTEILRAARAGKRDGAKDQCHAQARREACRCWQILRAAPATTRRRSRRRYRARRGRARRQPSRR